MTGTHEATRFNPLSRGRHAACSVGDISPPVSGVGGGGLWCGRPARNAGRVGCSASSYVAAPHGHHPATAKSVIFLFMEGGPSQLDTFDRKPLLNELAGKPLPSSFREPLTAMGEKNSPLLATKRKWARYGESGLEISDWFPTCRPACR